MLALREDWSDEAMAVNAREARQDVNITARMRLADRWVDVAIRNISSRGLLGFAEVTPKNGEYIEVRKGQHVIVGRVMWTDENRFGVYAQDRIDIHAFVNQLPPSQRPAGETQSDRRARPRIPDQGPTLATIAANAERSRRRSAAMQFVLIALFGSLVAVFAAGMVWKSMHGTLERAARHLDVQ